METKIVSAENNQDGIIKQPATDAGETLLAASSLSSREGVRSKEKEPPELRTYTDSEEKDDEKRIPKTPESENPQNKELEGNRITWAETDASLSFRVKEIIATYLGYLLHPFTSLSSEKIRFLHYPQVFLSIPVGAFAISLPKINHFFPINPELSAAIMVAYIFTVLFSILESIRAKKNALILNGSFDVIPIISSSDRHFLTGEVIKAGDTLGEFHWNPNRRVADCDKDEKLLALSTILSFIDSYLDLSIRLRERDPKTQKFKAFKITSEIVDDNYSHFGAEVTSFTNNPFFEKLDHFASRVNLLLNKRYVQAVTKKVRTSKVAWFAPNSLSSDQANLYLVHQKESLEKAIERRKQQLLEEAQEL